PEGDLLAKALVHRGECLLDMGDAPVRDLLIVLRHKRLGSERERPRLLASSDPGRREYVLQQYPLALRERLEVQVRRPPSERGFAIRSHAHELQALGEDEA